MIYSHNKGDTIAFIAMDPQTQKEDINARPVLTPDKTPSWKFGITLTVVVALPLLIIAGFYFGLFNL
ncbi:MAG: hypothetical protein ACFB4I_06695 [Cyanophyceae cyanobacterium]